MLVDVGDSDDDLGLHLQPRLRANLGAAVCHDDAQEKVRPQIETLEKNTENLAAVMSQMRDDFDALLPAVIDWEKTESKEELAQSLR